KEKNFIPPRDEVFRGSTLLKDSFPVFLFWQITAAAVPGYCPSGGSPPGEFAEPTPECTSPAFLPGLLSASDSPSLLDSGRVLLSFPVFPYIFFYIMRKPAVCQPATRSTLHYLVQKHFIQRDELLQFLLKFIEKSLLLFFFRLLHGFVAKHQGRQGIHTDFLYRFPRFGRP